MRNKGAMRAHRGRKKKLIVAFHFQYANQAGWRCRDCRQEGLEERRRCGWLPLRDMPGRVVWARNGVSVDTCPTSYVTAQSSAFIQEYQVWKMFGGVSVIELPARSVEAFCILENEMKAEMRRDNQTA